MRTSISTVEYLAVVLLVFTIVYFAKSLRSNDGKKKIPPLAIISIGALIFAIYSFTIGIDLFEKSDRHRYIISFFNYSNYNYNEIFGLRATPGTFLLFKSVATFTDNVSWLFFIVTFVFFIVNLNVITKLSINYKASALFFMLSQLPFWQLEILKQVLAYSMASIAFLYYIKEKKKLSIFFAVIACTFHLTAAVLFLYYIAFGLAARKKMGTILMFLSIIITSVILYGAVNFVAKRFGFVQQYLRFSTISVGSGVDTGRSGLTSGLVSALAYGLPYYFLLILSLIQYKKLVASDAKNKIYICILLYGSFFFIQGYVFFSLFRVGMFIIVPAVAWAPTLFASVKSSGTRFACRLVFIGLLLTVTIWHVAWKVDDYSIFKLSTVAQ